MTDHEMQSQGLVAQRNRLFCDLKTDEEKAAFFLSGRGYDSGVIAHSIQHDVSMAYQRCSEYRKEMKDLQAENERLRKDVGELVEALETISEIDYDTPIDDTDTVRLWAACDGIRRAKLIAVKALAAHRKQGGGE